MVDLQASVFPVGASALTSFAHIGVQLWRSWTGWCRLRNPRGAQHGR
ncbi:MAG: hypothetical protein JO283_21070 [Bradyrhizobium sp.]|nr:hypothetical protein [Bradyrhizobium sp.]